MLFRSYTLSRTIDRAGRADLSDEAHALSAAWARFLDVRQALPAIPRDHWMSFATDVLDGFGTTLAAWILLDQALVAGSETRATLARFFIAYDLPRAHRAFDLALRKPVPLLDFTGDAP